MLRSTINIDSVYSSEELRQKTHPSDVLEALTRHSLLECEPNTIGIWRTNPPYLADFGGILSIHRSGPIRFWVLTDLAMSITLVFLEVEVPALFGKYFTDHLV